MSNSDPIRVGTIAQSQAVAIGANNTVHVAYNYYAVQALRAPLRAQFAGLIEDRMRLFGGRTAALLAIKQFIERPQGGYLLITAPAGFGKTALMAALVGATPAAFAYHFFAPAHSPSSIGEIPFLKNVVDQLAQWHGRKEPVPAQLDELFALYQDYLGTELDRTRVLILDGLDEVTAWKLQPYFGRQLPNGFKLILTARDRDEDWGAALKLPPEQLTRLPLDGLGQDDLKQVFQNAGHHGELIAANPAALTVIAEKAVYTDNPALGADPFYITLLAGDLAQRSAALPPLTLAQLKQQPQGMEAYLGVWWAELKQRLGDTPASALFGALAAALGPLTEQDLKAISPGIVSGWDSFDDTLAKLRRFIIGDAQRGYSLFHPRLRIYLAEHIEGQLATYRAQLIRYCADWDQHRSRYALTYAARQLAESEAFEALYALVLNPAFQQAQRDLLNDPSATLNDLRLALTGALARNELVRALECVAAYRQIARSTSVAASMFVALDQQDYAGAQRRSQLYQTTSGWATALQLTIAWHAAQDVLRGVAAQETVLQIGRPAAAEQPGTTYATLCDALVVGIARALAAAPGSAHDAAGWLAELRPQAQATLLEQHVLAAPLTPDALAEGVQRVEAMLDYLGVKVAKGEPGVRSLPAEPAVAEQPAEAFLDQVARPVPVYGVLNAEIDAEALLGRAEGDQTFITQERTGVYADQLGNALALLAAHPEGQERITWALSTALLNPYPRYRDITLAAVATAALACPDQAWARTQLRQVLAGGIDREGVSFTFDLPFALLFEAVQRKLPPQDLGFYYRQALGSDDRWGTLARAHSARAAAMGRMSGVLRDKVAQELNEAVQHVSGFSGLACVTALTLLDRCYEFGWPQQFLPGWDASQIDQLKNLAHALAAGVRDPDFRQERGELMHTYLAWLDRAAPTPDGITELLDAERRRDGRSTNAERDRAERLALIGQLSARWAWPPAAPNLEGLKALVPLALNDATTLDAVLARLYGASLHQFDADQLGTLITLCAAALTAGRPWELGRWT